MSIPYFGLKVLHKIHPSLMWQVYRYQNRHLLTQSAFILSFDCDTAEDIDVVLSIHKRLQDMGITPVYAVPGALLQQGATVYRQIHAMGAEFINHGGREHTYFDTINHRHASCFFYDQQSLLNVQEDIESGHQIIQKVLGFTPIGWRTPHFGTFQQPHHLKNLYKTLNHLNYQFSTSTSPLHAYQQAALYRDQGIIEIPVTGAPSAPFNILDTWAYFAAPDRVKNPAQYLQACQQLVKLATHQPLLINIYGDPSHIHDQSTFFTGMQQLVNTVRNINYCQLLKETHDRICPIL